MFNFFSILLLLIAVLQIVVAIKIWVKPSKLRYMAEINCLHRNLPITIKTATHFSLFGEPGTTGYVDIDTDFSGCDHHIPTVKVQITKIWCFRSDSMEEIPKAELSAPRSNFVLGFNIAPSAHKQFYFQPSSSNFGVSQRPLRPLLDYELKIKCNYQHSESWLQKVQTVVFGSGVQFNGQNGINIPIYEIEMLALCRQGKIGLVIYNAERERTKIDVTREFLLENDAFNINMSNKTIQPTQGRTENNDPVLRTIAWRIPSGASSSTTGHPEASAMATAHDEAITLSQIGETESEVEETESEDDETDSETALEEAITLSQAGETESEVEETESEDDETDSETALEEAITLSQAGETKSEVDEMEPKQQSEKDESVSEQNICKICLERQRKIAFVPCGHFCACHECSKEIIKKKKECPICRQKIREALPIFPS